MSGRYAPGHFDGDGCTFPDPGHFAESDAGAPCGVTFRHDWHGFLDDDGRTRVCDGEIGPRHNHDADGVYGNCPACGTVTPPEATS